MGALAGFWAGVAVAIFGLATLLVLSFMMYQSRESISPSSISLSSLVFYVSSGISRALLALLAGTAIGAFGGFIGKIYSENAVSQPTASAQPTASVQPPLPAAKPIEPTPPSADQQNQA